jgi:putative transposase
MSRKRYTPEQVLGMLRQAEVELAQGKRIGEVCRSLGISEQSYYRWRSEYGGLKLDQARRMKDLEKENGRLKKAVAELTLDKQILKEAIGGSPGEMYLVTQLHFAQFSEIPENRETGWWMTQSHANRSLSTRQLVDT